MIKNKKSLGQNWLINPEVHAQIVSALAIEPTDQILEVGPGTGLLTKHLATTGARILAVEKDGDLATKLTAQYQSSNNVKIVEGDILNFKPQDYGLLSNQFKVVGNIPYYLSSHLIRILLEEWPTPRLIVLLLQQEVAERLTAQPGEMSLLGLAAQYYSQTELLSIVPRSDIDPVPEVDSAIVRLTPNQLRTDQAFNQKFFHIAHAAFGNKRKQLISSLSTNLKLDRAELVTILNQCQISPQARPETLTVSDWERLVSSLPLVP